MDRQTDKTRINAAYKNGRITGKKRY